MAQGRNYDSKASGTYWLTFVVVTLSNFLFGYNISVMSGALLSIKTEFGLTAWLQEMVVSITTVGGMVASFAGGPLADFLGRKRTVLLAALVTSAGVIGCAASGGTAVLVAFRLLTGLGIGVGSSAAPLFVSEASPASLRGKAVSACTLGINVGIMVASIVTASAYYAGALGWRLSLGGVAVAAGVQLLGLLAIPESPRWLVEKGRQEEAIAAMRRLRADPEVADDEVAAIRESCEEEAAEKAAKGGQSLLKSVWAVPSVRRALVTGLGMQFFQPLTGITIVLGYTGTILQMSGVKSQGEILWLSVGVFTGLLALQTFTVYGVERLGRRSSSVVSMGGSAVALLFLGLGFQLIDANTPTNSVGALGLDSSACASAAHCYDCVASLPSCGFCYESGAANGTLGTCVALRDAASAVNGSCNATLAASSPVTLATNYCPSPYSWMAMAGLCLFILVFGPGMGGMPWVVNSEIFPQWARSTCNAAGAAMNWLMSLVTTGTFLSLTEALGVPGTYYLYCVFSLIGTLFIHATLPETKGKTLEEVDQLFASGFPGLSCGKKGIAGDEKDGKTKTGKTNKTFQND